MNKPALFDVIKLLIYLPQYDLRSGVQGAIVECYHDRKYEVKFANPNGETSALCTLSSEQFIVVWKATTKRFVEEVSNSITHHQ